MIIAASDEALRDSQISVKTSKLLALDQNPGSKEAMSSKGSMGQDVFPDAPALPFCSGRRLLADLRPRAMSAFMPLLRA
jgi:hypothetical protein